MTLSLGGDPRQVAVALDGQSLEGQLSGPVAATTSFQALTQRWSVSVPLPAATALQSALPWIAVGWPIVIAGIAFLVAGAAARRRRAERAVERIFDVSLDLLCVVGLSDGYFKRVNPGFERALGYSSSELLSRPFLEFVHPDDRQRTGEAFDTHRTGHDVVQFENRYLHSDGSVRWLQWSGRAVLGEGLVYAVARDVTERRRDEERLRAAQRAVEESRDELRAIAAEQLAVRRVATLVARGAPSDEVFDAVSAEVAELFEADSARLLRYEVDGTATVVAARNGPLVDLPVGTGLTLEGESVAAAVRRSAQSARIQDFSGLPGSIAERNRMAGLHSALGAPVVVEGALWGVMVVAWARREGASAAVEARVSEFTELVAVAIANAHARAELVASRARVVAAADEARHRIERNLHDDTQQRLVSLMLTLQATADAVPPHLGGLKKELIDAASELEEALDNLREISRGIYPAPLSRHGLEPALKALARRSTIPVELQVGSSGRFDEAIERTVYYVVSEALANAAKHSGARRVSVELGGDDTALHLSIKDDGAGGADPGAGSGLIGLRDRVESVGGSLTITSPASSGTLLSVTIPLRRTNPHPTELHRAAGPC
jgi:PAS domain S-box-containing protein